MRKIILTLIIFSSLFVTSCRKEQILDSSERTSKVNLNTSKTDYQSAFDNRTPQSSDPFVLNEITKNGSTINISVSYSGGCEIHTFDVIWNGIISNTSTNTPQVDFILQHNANGDECEAWITEIITIDLTDVSDSIYFPDVIIDIYNGSSENDSLYFEDPENTGEPFEIVESDTCNMIVTATGNVCGWGLFDNIWFELPRVNLNYLAYSDTSGYPDVIGGIYGYYLQPLAIDESLAGFKPVEGKKYSIGVRKASLNDYPEFANQITCMAYFGPSIPVKIMCIKEIE